MLFFGDENTDKSASLGEIQLNGKTKQGLKNTSTRGSSKMGNIPEGKKKPVC